MQGIAQQIIETAKTSRYSIETVKRLLLLKGIGVSIEMYSALYTDVYLAKLLSVQEAKMSEVEKKDYALKSALIDEEIQRLSQNSNQPFATSTLSGGRQVENWQRLLATVTVLFKKLREGKTPAIAIPLFQVSRRLDDFNMILQMQGHPERFELEPTIDPNIFLVRFAEVAAKS